jgi:SAM-dependent methyltransferase
LPLSNRIDPAVPYGSFGLRWVLRQRLKWARDALPGDRFATVLEIGYGKGVFMLELAKHASHVCGCDVHDDGADVRRQLTREGVIPHLVRSPSEVLPFRDGAFDAVVIVSALEQLRDPGRTLREAVRVVLPGGAVVCVAPRVLRWADRLGTLLGTERDNGVHDGRVRVQAALADRSLRAERSLRPRLAPRFLAPYEVVVLRRLPVHAGRGAEPTVDVSYTELELGYEEARLTGSGFRVPGEQIPGEQTAGPVAPSRNWPCDPEPETGNPLP